MKRSGGFTFVELIVVMIVIGALGAVMLPRLVGPGDSEAALYGDRVLTVLRLAQKTAVAHRRVVCVNAQPKSFQLRVAASNPITTPTCTVPLTGADDADASTTHAAVNAFGSAGMVGATLFFQPGGDITSDLGGTTPVRGTISVTRPGGGTRTITVEGATGYVDFSG